uniref:Cysteine dioxygenase n=1 Tax=Percolomonas cosmopolitus TaxID=63605 RepID=A0A7S1KLE2_9EUKA|mmetsp:Transcript_1073/g.3653  ORF Transcript_1073/g.3653 Transcript_1073/m.3653 type:complete len:227 (+) Transcript_1073:52-732(+)
MQSPHSTNNCANSTTPRSSSSSTQQQAPKLSSTPIIKHSHVIAPSIRNLINQIDSIQSRSDVSDSQKSNLLGQLMKSFPLRNRDLKKYALIEQSAPYTRNLIWETETYALILMCWKPRTDSVIHTHGGSSCWARVVNGEVSEKRYKMDPETDEPLMLSQEVHEVGSVTYIDDSLGLHALCNPTNAFSMSLHLYTPPIRSSTYFDANDREMHVCHMKYHHKHHSTST